MDSVDTIELEPQHKDRINILALILFLFIALLIAFYTLLFTAWGNRQCTPFIEDQLSQALDTNVTITTFSLDLERFELAFHDATHLNVQTSGSYQFIPPSMDARYSVKSSSDSSLIPIDINGKIHGGYSRLQLIGNAKLFGGKTSYNAVLHYGSVSSLHLILEQIGYQNLMDLLEYPHNSDTLLSGNININGIDTRMFSVSGKLKATTHHFTPSPIMDEDNESFNFWELLADENGKITPFHLDAKVEATLDELGILEQFVSYPLRSPISATLTVAGSEHALRGILKGEAAKGKLDSEFHLHTLKPNYFHVEAKQIDVGSLFSMLSLPHPVEGTLGGSLSSDFNTTTLKVSVNKGKTNPSILKKYYHITQPFIHFNSNLSMKITPTSTYTTGQFKSDLDNLQFEDSPTHDAMLRELLRQMKQKSPKGNL